MAQHPSSYQELQPCEALKHFVHSYWEHQNHTASPQEITIFPDSYFKIVVMLKAKKVVRYFITGLWPKERKVIIPANATTLGCRIKILGPELLLHIEVASILQGLEQLEIQYLNMDRCNFSNFGAFVNHIEKELLKMKSPKEIPGNKLRLSQLLDITKGDISATEVSNQIYWTNRQINRYLNKYLGVSLKKYLNIQKCYQAYPHIREGKFYPETGFFDQPHFIKEIKKHTGETPKSLHQDQNDRFIQLKRISKK